MSEVTYRRVDMEGRAWFRDLRGRIVVEVERQPGRRSSAWVLVVDVPVSEG